MAFVMRQPSARSMPPVDPRLDETSETDECARWMAGRLSNAGTLANGLSEIRSSLVSDIKGLSAKSSSFLTLDRGIPSD